MPSPTVIIDLSAIAYPNDGVGQRPDWRRVDEAVRAWRVRDPRAVFYGVLDNRTWHQFDARSQDRFNDWKRQKKARAVPWADEAVLTLATEHSDALVLTTDLYRDLRRRFPWLQGTDRVLKPVFSTDVQFEALDYSPIPDHEVSWRVEEADLKPKGMTSPEARRALQQEWRCGNLDCLWGQAQLVEADPKFHDGVVLCPACETPVRKIGDRDRTRELVVLLEGEEIDRIPVVETAELTIGRGRGHDRYDVRTALDERGATSVSREHVRVTNRAGRLFAEELGSRNGTAVNRVDGGASQLQPGVLQALDAGESISLADGNLRFRQSGRRRAHGRYAPDLATPPWNPKRS